MPYYAKIENGVVVNVIVADEDFIRQFPGELWVETDPRLEGGRAVRPMPPRPVTPGGPPATPPGGPPATPPGGPPATPPAPPLPEEAAVPAHLMRRKNFPLPGYTYDEVEDMFVPPRPFGSWYLDKRTGEWKPPIPQPKGERPSRWDERSKRWVFQ